MIKVLIDRWTTLLADAVPSVRDAMSSGDVGKLPELLVPRAAGEAGNFVTDRDRPISPDEPEVSASLPCGRKAKSCPQFGWCIMPSCDYVLCCFYLFQQDTSWASWMLSGILGSDSGADQTLNAPVSSVVNFGVFVKKLTVAFNASIVATDPSLFGGQQRRTFTTIAVCRFDQLILELWSSSYSGLKVTMNIKSLTCDEPAPGHGASDQDDRSQDTMGLGGNEWSARRFIEIGSCVAAAGGQANDLGTFPPPGSLFASLQATRPPASSMREPGSTIYRTEDIDGKDKVLSDLTGIESLKLATVLVNPDDLITPFDIAQTASGGILGHTIGLTHEAANHATVEATAANSSTGKDLPTCASTDAPGITSTSALDVTIVLPPPDMGYSDEGRDQGMLEGHEEIGVDIGPIFIVFRKSMVDAVVAFTQVCCPLPLKSLLRTHQTLFDS